MTKASRRAGMALVELLTASSIALMVFAGAAVTLVAVQRSFMASLSQIDSQADQNRVFSYLRRDLRGASAVQIAAEGTQLTITSPAKTKPPVNLNLGAALLSLLMPPQSVPSSVTVRYYRQGTSILRETGGASVELTKSATQFQCALQGGAVRVDAGFQPRYTFGVRSLAGATTKASASVRLLNTQQ